MRSEALRGGHGNNLGFSMTQHPRPVNSCGQPETVGPTMVAERLLRVRSRVGLRGGLG